MLFENNDFDVNLDLFIADFDSSINSNKTKLYEPMEGFLRGNMFKEEYLPYKGLTYFKLNPKNEQECSLYSVMAYDFAVNDLNLYLDLNPDDKDVFEIFKKYLKEAKKLCKEYEEKYGPLTLRAVKGNKYDWLDDPWPWDNSGGSTYV